MQVGSRKELAALQEAVKGRPLTAEAMVARPVLLVAVTVAEVLAAAAVVVQAALPLLVQ